MTSAAEETVGRVFEAFTGRDGDALAALCAPDVWFEPASTQVAHRSVYEGRDGMRGYVADVELAWQHFEVTIGELREVGPVVLALGRVYARAAGFVADNPIAFVWEIGDDGLVRWGKTFTDRATAEKFALECARCGPPS